MFNCAFLQGFGPSTLGLLKMGKSGKLFKALVAGVKAFKSPSKEKPEKDKSASKSDKDHLVSLNCLGKISLSESLLAKRAHVVSFLYLSQKKGNKEKCLWSLGKSSSRNRDSLAAAAAFLDPPEIKSTQVENKHVKDVPTTVTTKTGYGPKGLVKAEDPSFTGHDPMELVEKEELAAIKIQTAYRRHLVKMACLHTGLHLDTYPHTHIYADTHTWCLNCFHGSWKCNLLMDLMG